MAVGIADHRDTSGPGVETLRRRRLASDLLQNPGNGSHDAGGGGCQQLGSDLVAGQV
jgi:hypothetical protein